MRPTTTRLRNYHGCFSLCNLIFSSQSYPLFSLAHQTLVPYSHTHVRTYVDVYMKWKKDRYYDSIDSIHKSPELKPIISLKNLFISSSTSPHDNYCIPISAISKMGKTIGVSIRVARFLRNYPSFFQEFEGPLYNLPWFRLTDKAIELHRQEIAVYGECKDDIMDRVKKLVLMSGKRRVLPLKVINNLRWYLGLPDEFKMDPGEYVRTHSCFKIVDVENGLKGLAVAEDSNLENEGKILSVMQKNAKNSGVYSGGANEAIPFPLFPSKGLRLKVKIKDWLHEFQSIPYISPYDDFSYLNPDSDLSEKRVVGLLHEILCLFVEHAAERKSIFSLRKYLRMPQKVHKAFERHPHIFYLSLKNKTCTAILKEAHCDELAIEPHPLAKVRKEYISLMKESAGILKNRRFKSSSRLCEKEVSLKDSGSTDDERSRLQDDLDFTDNEKCQLAEAHLYGRDSGGPSLFSSKPQLLGGDLLLPSTTVAGTTDQWTNMKASEVPTQFTIFYNGTVHSFDNISPEKAEAIILLAGKGIVSNLAQAKNQVQAPVFVQETGKPIHLFLNGALVNQSMITPKCSTMPSPISVSLNVTAADNDDIKVPNTISMSPALAAIKVESPVMRSSGTLKDIPLARKISVARFLEKRKERAMKAAPYNLIKKEADSGTSESVVSSFPLFLELAHVPGVAAKRLMRSIVS